MSKPFLSSVARRRVLTLLLGLLAAWPSVLLAQPDRRVEVRDPTAEGLGGADDDELYRCKKYPPRARIKVTLKPETELEDMVKWVMGFTCKNFVYGSNISGRNTQKLTVIAPSNMSPRDAYALFLVGLQVMNLTVVDKGPVMEIVERPRAKENPLPVYTESTPPGTDKIVRAVYRPTHMSVDDMAVVFNSLKSKDGLVVLLPAAGALVVTDAGNVIRSMMRVGRELDQPAGGGERLYLIKVNYADAAELAETVREIYGLGAGGTSAARPPARNNRNRKAPAAPISAGGSGDDTSVPSKILPIERTNSLIVVGTEEAYQRTVALVRRLDSAIGDGDGSIHVYYLANADAEELANTLSSLISGSARTAASARNRNRRNAPTPAAQGGDGSTFEGDVKIAFDKSTNALVVVSTMKDFLSLTEVIRKLDRPRRQVFVEATILEVGMDRVRNLGAAFHGGAPVDVGGEESLLFGGVQHGQLSTLFPQNNSLEGIIGGIRGPTIPVSQEILGISIPSFGVQLQFLQTNNDVNVLSSPHLLTTDNEEAEITVGQNIPYQSGTAVGAGAGAAGAAIPALAAFTQPVQRQDVGLKLKITPHVNDSDFVRLEIEQEIEDVASTNFGGNGPSWTTRSVKTTVVVKDQQTVVIGGLMSENVIIDESKVPFLGDIPILGYLFKYSSQTKRKTNLILFLTPYVIYDQSDIRRIFERKMRERREFLESFRSFREYDFVPEMDYERKRGLVAEIDYQARQLEEEQTLREEAEAEIRRYEQGDGPIDLGAPPPEGEDGAGIDGEGDYEGRDNYEIDDVDYGEGR